MILSLALRRAVALEADAIYERAKALGELAARSIVGERGGSQVRGLENVANGSLKVSDILDYVKRQTARHKEWQDGNFGAELLRCLEEDLYQRARGIAAGVPELAATWQQQIHLALIREFVRQLIVHYEYTVWRRGHEVARGSTDQG